MKAPNSSAGSTRKPALRPSPSGRQPAAETTQARRQSAKELKAEFATEATRPASDKAPAPQTLPRQKPLYIPPILLEGDYSAPPVVSGPGEKYSLGPTPPASPTASETAPLPEAYGTQMFYLAARDPHWLYAHWDLTRAQLLDYNARSADRHLKLRIYTGAVAGQPVAEIHVHPESRHWFVHVERAATAYAAELGFYQADRQWVRIASSNAAVTPPDAASAVAPPQFATIPLELPLPRLLELVKRALREDVPLALALEELRAAGYPDLPPSEEPTVSDWTSSQERALTEILSGDDLHRVRMGSLEITELIRHQIQKQVASPGAEAGWPAALEALPSGISSPSGGAPGLKGFWLNVNAELIIYGATEPDASVTIAGCPVQLRPDGSFSCRFALPDGHFALPVAAVSADQADIRAAELEFSRKSKYHGDVGMSS